MNRNSYHNMHKDKHCQSPFNAFLFVTFNSKFVNNCVHKSRFSNTAFTLFNFDTNCIIIFCTYFTCVYICSLYPISNRSSTPQIPAHSTSNDPAQTVSHHSIQILHRKFQRLAVESTVMPSAHTITYHSYYITNLYSNLCVSCKTHSIQFNSRYMLPRILLLEYSIVYINL